MDDIILSIKGLSKDFGKLVALKKVDMDVRGGQIHGLIGPNGSGKTTLVNVITGMLPATEGNINFNGADITRVKPHIIAGRLGISRTYQLAQLFPMMTCLQNILVGAHNRVTTSIPGLIFRLPFRRSAPEEEIRRRSLEVLKFIGLEGYAERWTNELGWMECQLIQIARALVGEPKLLLLDEPTAGMGVDESRKVADIIKQVRDKGITVMLISHDMKLVMGIADWITVLEFGNKICEGPPAKVVCDPKVIEAYLGEENAAAG